MERSSNIDDFFREKISTIQVEFEEEAWNDLEKQLNKKKHKERVLLWWWHWEKIAAVLLIGFLGYGVYDFNQNSSGSKRQVGQKNERKEAKIFSFRKAFSKNSIKNQENTSTPSYKNFITENKNKTKIIHFTSQNKADSVIFERNLVARNLPRKQWYWHSPSTSNSLVSHANQEKKNTWKVSHTIGFAFSPLISPSALQAGVGYTHEFGVSKRTSVVSGLAYTPWVGNTKKNDNHLVATNKNVHLQTIEIPLEAKVKITEKLSISSGVNNTFLLQEKIGDATNNDLEWGISSLNIGVQYDLRIGKNSYINLQPYYRFPLQSIGSAGTQISGFGVRTGYSYGKSKKVQKNIIEN